MKIPYCKFELPEDEHVTIPRTPINWSDIAKLSLIGTVIVIATYFTAT